MAGAILVASAEPLAGKSTIAAALARKLPGTTITEAAGTDPPTGDGKVVVVATPSSPDLAAYCRSIGHALAGIVLNRVPAKRAVTAKKTVKAAGLPLLAALPEDQLLAAPTLRDVIGALTAEATFLNGSETRVIERPVIASISADPAQGYFAYVNPSAVIVRSDKPDLQLAALNAGATCLIVTGGYPILSYVLDRVQEDEIPLLRTPLDTLKTIEALESLFGTTPFTPTPEKLARLDELLADADLSSLSS